MRNYDLRNCVACSLAFCMVCQITAESSAAPTKLTTEHVDIGLVEDGALSLHWHDETNGNEYEPDEAIAIVNPDVTATRNSTSYYVLPSSQNPTTLYLGAGAEDSDGSFGVWDPGDSRIAPGSFDWIRLNLVAVSGPGHFAVWTDEDWMNSSDGIDSDGSGNDDDVLYALDGGHGHFNWGFSELGEYDIDFSVTASVGGTVTTSGTETFTFAVPEPTSAALVIGMGGLALMRGRRRQA